MYRLSNTSKRRLSGCHTSLVEIFELAISRSSVDFGIACGFRSVEEQQRLYSQGRTIAGAIVTGIDGINNKSKHNHTPSQAVDIYGYVNGKATWDHRTLCYIAGVVMTCAQELGYSLRWGGNWDRDGEIISDQNLIDLPHFEI